MMQIVMCISLIIVQNFYYGDVKFALTISELVARFLHRVDT